MRVVVLAMFMCGVAPTWAAAQTAPGVLPGNDAIISLGWAGSDHEIHDQKRWHGSLLVGLSGGHYWTHHVKTEIEASWNDPGKSERYETFERQGGVTYALSDYRAHDVRVGVAQLYQFGRNEWVHPYVGVGVDAVRRRQSIERAQQSRSVYVQNRTIPVVIPAASESVTRIFAQPFVKTGVKMYASEKVFFNTELKVGVKRNVDHVVWKIGMGFDF
jgi:opacity protein-like surface antigen